MFSKRITILHSLCSSHSRAAAKNFSNGRIDGFGITNSFWKDEASMKAWKQNVDHKLAQKLGREIFYSHYVIRIAKVERDYSFEKADV